MTTEVLCTRPQGEKQRPLCGHNLITYWPLVGRLPSLMLQSMYMYAYMHAVHVHVHACNTCIVGYWCWCIDLCTHGQSFLDPYWHNTSLCGTNKGLWLRYDFVFTCRGSFDCIPLSTLPPSLSLLFVN